MSFLKWSPTENGKDVRGLDYARLTAVLIEAVKEQQIQSREISRQKDEQIEALKEQIAQLAADTWQLQAEVTAFRAQNTDRSKIAAVSAGHQ